MKEMYGKQVYNSLRETVDTKHTALVVVDVQNDFVAPDGHFAKGGKDVSMLISTVPNMVRLVEEARKAGMKVVFIQNTTLGHGLSDSPSWLRFKSKASGTIPIYTMDGTWGQESMVAWSRALANQ